MRKHASSSKPGILVADEVRDLADIYGYLFTAAGYDVGVAYDGLTAAALAKVKRPHLAVVNYHLPGLGALAFLKELRDAGARTQVIVTSGMDGFSALAERALAEGAKYCVRQPCPAERLLRMASELRATSAPGR